MIEKIIASPYLYPLWRIGWLERAFFHVCRLFRDVRQSAFLDINFGFDISKWQGVVDFLKMLAFGARFLILRCGYGIKIDERFEEYIAAAYGVLPLATYHFYDPIYDPVAQAKKVIAILEPHKHKIRRVWLDLEFWWTGAYSDPKYWKTYRDTIKAAGYKVGWYTRKTWWDSRVGVYAAEFAKDPLWAAQYNAVLNLIPKGWLKATVWQEGTPAIGLEAGVGSREIDRNLWNDEMDFLSEWGVIAPPPDPLPYQKVSRYGSYVYVAFGDPKTDHTHVTNTEGKLETVSSVAPRLNGKIVINGDGWWEVAPPRPLSISVSDGKIYQGKQYDFRPFLNITQNKAAQIKWNNYADLYNTVSGTRQIVLNGSVNPILFDTGNIANTEKHPRTAVGIDASGRLVLVVVDGRSEKSAGVLLVELARILIEFGSVDALELDGGGSSAMWVEDRIVNVPSDGQERAVINHLVIGTTGEPMAKNKVTITWDSGAREREKPRVNAVDKYRNLLLDNTVHYSEFDPVPDMDDPTNADKRWIQLQSGWWVAVKYPSSSGIIERAKVEAVTEDPPTPAPHVVEVYVDGLLEYRKELT